MKRVDPHKLLTQICYRPEIDGLRALAVLPVVLFHAFPEYVPGGFIGVDVFFVISGFLISGIIFHEQSIEAFSLRRFYERRVRRIFPALLLVLATTAIAGWWIFLHVRFCQPGQTTHRKRAIRSEYLFLVSVGIFQPRTERSIAASMVARRRGTILYRLANCPHRPSKPIEVGTRRDHIDSSRVFHPQHRACGKSRSRFLFASHACVGAHVLSLEVTPDTFFLFFKKLKNNYEI